MISNNGGTGNKRRLGLRHPGQHPGFKKKPGGQRSHLKTRPAGPRPTRFKSKAGDVVIMNGSQHTELVTKDGGKEAISCNGGSHPAT